MEFLVKGIEDTNVRAYYDFMVDAAVIFGANKTDAERELLDSLKFEIELAKVVSSKFVDKYFKSSYHICNIILDCCSRRRTPKSLGTL